MFKVLFDMSKDVIVKKCIKFEEKIVNGNFVNIVMVVVFLVCYNLNVIKLDVVGIIFNVELFKLDLVVGEIDIKGIGEFFEFFIVCMNMLV